MARLTPELDHVVIDVRDRMDEAVAQYRTLGFNMTPRGYHTLGSINHLAVFGTDYLELLGSDPGRPARPELVDFPTGLNGLVFRAGQPEEVHASLHAAGVPVEEPVSFSRPVQLAEGAREARFRVVRLPRGTAGFGRVYFCHHFTPELVWRPEFQAHPNGSVAISRLVIAARDPAGSAALFARMFGADAVRAEADGSRVLRAGEVVIELATHDAVRRDLGAAMPDAAGRADFMAALHFRTSSLARTRSALAGQGGSGSDTARLVVPAAAAMNVALVFQE